MNNIELASIRISPSLTTRNEYWYFIAITKQDQDTKRKSGASKDLDEILKIFREKFDEAANE